jgi:hypothetical protein
LKSQLDEKLLGAMNSISQQIIDFSDANGTQESKASALSDFLQVNSKDYTQNYHFEGQFILQLTFTHFRLIVQYHIKLLALLENAERVYSGGRSQNSMTRHDIWGHVQAVVSFSCKHFRSNS